MHIAFIIPFLLGGGAERVILNLTRGFIARGHRVDIVLFQNRIWHEIPNGARLFVAEESPGRNPETVNPMAPPEAVRLAATSGPADWFRMAGAVGWDLQSLPSPRLVGEARAVASYLAREKPDCVLPNLARATTATLLACGSSGGRPPVVPVVHGLVGFLRPRVRRRWTRLFPHAAHFIGISEGVSDSIATATGVPNGKITTIYNPAVPPDLHARMAEPTRHPWLEDSGAPVILAAGRLDGVKDYSTMIKAFALIARRRPCRLLILGEGPMRERLENLVHELDLDDRVALPGWVANPYAFMSRASLFVLSSIHEGLSMVLVEAMACGCPCVSTDCPTGPGEILRDGETGALVPVGDEAALAEAMERALDQPPDASILRRRADDFSVERAVEAYEKLLRRLVPPR